MNIKQIIREAIDRTLMKRYQGQLEGYLGTLGIDTAPLGNNPEAVKCVQAINDFAFDVDFALKHNLYKPSTGSGPTSTSQNGTSLKKSPKLQNADDSLVTKTVNYVTGAADDAYQYARQAGLGGFDPIVGGTISAFQSGYNGMQDKWNDNSNTKQQLQQQQVQNQTRKRKRPSGTDLTTLMGDQYRNIVTNYNYVNVNRQPGVLSRLRYMKELMQTLADIKNALGQP